MRLTNHLLSSLRSPCWSAALLATGLALACGSVDPADSSGTGGNPTGDAGAPAQAGAGADAGATATAGSPTQLEPLLPWAEGNTWTYRVTKDGVTTDKTTTVGELEPVGGEGPYADTLAHHVVTEKGDDGMDRTESWQAPDEENPLRIVRFREQSFGAMTGLLQLDEYWDPAKLHIDGSAERTAAGASWLESYSETKLEVGLTPTTHEVRDVWTVIADDETVEVPAGTFENVIHFQKAGGGSTKQYWYLRGVGKIKETGSQTEELVDYSVAEGEP